MKICMLVTSNLAKDPRVKKQALFAHDSGHEVTVICRTNLGETPPYKVVTLETKRARTLMGRYVERALSLFILLVRTIQTKPDLIHANDLDTLPVGYLAGRFTGAKVIYDSHELWPDISTRLNGISGKVANLFQRFICHRITESITVNEHLAEEMARRMGIAVPKVILNAPYLSKTQPTKAQRRKFWPDDYDGRKIILYQGRYIEGRGIWDVIDAAHQISNDAVIVFRGYGPLENEMRDQVQARSLEDKIFFVPAVEMEELVPAAVDADLGLIMYDPVNNSHRHVSPNKLFEFIMAGLPSVASDFPFLRKVICGHKLGGIYTPGNSQQLADTINYILDDQEGLAQMRANCQATKTMYCWEIEGQKLLEIYTNALK